MLSSEKADIQESEDLENQENQENSISLKDFLTEYKDILESKLRNNLVPLFDPHKVDKWDKEQARRLENLKRTLYPKQVNAVVALAKGFQSKKSLILTAECGTGKTIMALATAYLIGAHRIIVMCPGHLVQKWIREAQETIPGISCYNLNGQGLGNLLELKKGFSKPVGFEIYVIGKERAKLHYRLKSGAVYTNGRIACPDCGKQIVDDKLIKRIKTGKRVFCNKCGDPLFQADKKTKRFAKAEFFKHYVGKGFFDFLIADEIHELKGGTTAQGQAFADFCSVSKHVIALTGTLMGGYATNLFYIFWRMFPQKMKEAGFKFYDTTSFAENYGIVETQVVTEGADNNDYSIGKSAKTRRFKKEKPGVSPLMLTNFLLENTIFMKLSDVACNLPPYKEEIQKVEMAPEQAGEYRKFEAEMLQAMKKALLHHDKSLLGVMLQSLLALPDGARRGEIAVHPHSPDPFHPIVIASAKPIDIDILPKEEELIQIIAGEVSKGRQVLVCLEHTGTRDLTGDLKERIDEAGYKTVVLKANTVKPELREAWINDKAKNEKFDVLITNPRIIQTGLDLLDYPSIVFFQTGYSIFTLRQASRRSWRIGQTKDVKVIYFTYTDTIQEKALTLMATKMETALAIEGDLSDKGLVALSEGESSIMFALARELLKGKSGQTLEGAWNSYKKSEIENDSYITDTESIVTTTTIEKGDRKAEVSYKSIKRGYVYPKIIKNRKVGVAVIDNGKFTFYFFNGKVYWRKKVVGNYVNQNGRVTGIIADKPVELLTTDKHRFELIERRRA